MKKRFVLAMVLCIALCLAFGGAALASSADNSLGYVNDAVGLLSLDEQQELETTAVLTDDSRKRILDQAKRSLAAFQSAEAGNGR